MILDFESGRCRSGYSFKEVEEKGVVGVTGLVEGDYRLWARSPGYKEAQVESVSLEAQEPPQRIEIKLERSEQKVVRRPKGD